jgi:hypothetical protein
MSTATIPPAALAPVRVAAYTLTGSVDAIRDSRGRRFDLDTYSKMKHGHGPALAGLGRAVGEALREEQPHLFTANAPVLLPVAYMAVAPACWYLSQAVCVVLNANRVPAGLTPARIIRIGKDSVTATDYAASTAAERAAEMAGIRFTLDEPITGAHVVLVDDVRITGLAEQAAVGAMAHDSPASLTLAYVAVVDDALAASPHVEAAMNHATVRAVTDMLPSVTANEFVLTIRFLKRVLSAPTADREAFFAACPPPLLRDILAGAHSSGDTFLTGYAESVAALTREVTARDR